MYCIIIIIIRILLCYYIIEGMSFFFMVCLDLIGCDCVVSQRHAARIARQLGRRSAHGVSTCLRDLSEKTQGAISGNKSLDGHEDSQET